MRRFLFSCCPSSPRLVAATGGAQAIVVTDQGSTYGVALTPGVRTAPSFLAGGHLPRHLESTVHRPGALGGPRPAGSGLCSHGGAVMHANETFAVTWDPTRSYWQTTRNYVEQFLRDVADGSGTFTSPYAVTANTRTRRPRPTNFACTVVAASTSGYRWFCVPLRLHHGAARVTTIQSAPARSRAPTSSTNSPAAPSARRPTTRCLTDAQIQSEVASMIRQTRCSNGRTSPGYTPLIVLLTPPGVVTCLDSGGALCSANSSSAQKFCSYHSQVNVDGALYAYVVQPWTALTPCDEPDAPAIPSSPPADVFAKYVGIRLVSPLSQSQIACDRQPKPERLVRARRLGDQRQRLHAARERARQCDRRRQWPEPLPATARVQQRRGDRERPERAELCGAGQSRADVRRPQRGQQRRRRPVRRLDDGLVADRAAGQLRLDVRRRRRRRWTERRALLRQGRHLHGEADRYRPRRKRGRS